MPLDTLQTRIARTALALPQARTLALAGGAAMIVHGFVARETKDIDLFTEIDDQEAIRVAKALRQALESEGLITRDAERPPFDHRFIAVDPATEAPRRRQGARTFGAGRDLETTSTWLPCWSATAPSA